MSDLFLFLTAILVGLALFLPKNRCVLPLFLSCLIPLSQKVYLFSIDFTAFRIVLLFLWIRLLVKGELSSLRLTRIDKLFLGWWVANILIYSILRHDADAFVNRLGFAYNAFGFYFAFRVLIVDFDDLRISIKFIAITVALLTAMLLFERNTRTNLFSYLGASSFMPQIRDGKLRCQGPFSHPILAGSYAAGILPLLVTLSLNSPSRILIGSLWIGAAISCILLTNSSGPIIAALVSLVALVFWRFQVKLKSALWYLLGLAIALQLYMHSPIWYLFERLSAITGGTGYYRAILIDAFIKHFGEWVLFGTIQTAHWLPIQILPGDPTSTDVTNFYIRQAVDGGIAALFLFVLLIHNCFRAVGRIARAEGIFNREQKFFVWCLGASLLSHATSFCSVYYFDQSIVAFFFTIACINSIDQWRESRLAPAEAQQ